VYGTWLGTTFFGVLALVGLITLILLASPLFAILFALLAVAFLGSCLVLLRASGSRAAGPESQTGSGTPAGRPAGAASPSPRPHSGGAPASGEGA
jgi:hypothetical protein